MENFKEEKETNYNWDDNSFGIPMLAAAADSAMENNDVDSRHALAILVDLVEEWPEMYIRGGRVPELLALVNRVVKRYFLLTILIIVCLVSSASAVPAMGPLSTNPSGTPSELSRGKREGFGPWEANDAWDEKGKSNLAPVMNKLVEIIAVETKEVEQFLNRTVAFIKEVVEVVEHPVAELSKSYIGLTILGLALLSVLGIAFKLSIPLFKFIFGGFRLFFRFVIRPILSLMARSVCCMYFCASKPLVAFRNMRMRTRMEKDTYDRMRIYTPLTEEIQVLKKTESSLYTDDKGIYLLADANHRVYLHTERQTEDVLMMKALSDLTRDKGATVDTIKESILTTSKLYKVDKLPDFQGTFEVDGNLIGHFSRIRFNGLDCLLTAYHVLDYNRTALINLRKGDKCITLDSVTANVVAASHTDQLDFLILSVPACVFSTLGMKVGVWTSRVQPREPIQIYQLFEGKPCVSSAAVKISTAKSWHINYGASTTVGTSGAPILDSKSRIVGVHLEHDTVSKQNVGIIPPIFRMNKKESPTNEDIAQGQPELVLYEDEEGKEEEEAYINEDDFDDEYLEMEAYETYLTKYSDNLEVYEKGTPWGMFMDDTESSVAEDMRERYSERYEVYKTTAGTRGGHIGSKVKGGMYRKLETPTAKESPWTCSKCACIQYKGFSCINCGYALVPLSRRTVKQQEKGANEAKAFIETKLPTELVKKISDDVMSDLTIKRIALQVASLLKKGRYLSGLNLQDEIDGGIYPDLPTNERVPIQASLVKRVGPISPEGCATPPLVVDGNVLYTVVPTLLPGDDLFQDGLKLVKKRVAAVNRKETFTVEVAPTSLAASISESIEDSGQAHLSKSASRRLRIKEKMATLQRAVEVRPAVPLNSPAPVKSGVLTISGTKTQSPSPASPKKLEKAISSSKGAASAKQQRSGNKPALKDQSTQSTPGPHEEPKQKNKASSSSATSTS